MMDKPNFILQTYEDRLAGKELSQKLSERLSNLTNGPPPPPPPPDSPSSSTLIKSNKKGKAPPVPVKTSTLSYNHNQPPPCPTPDYDTLSITSTMSLPKQNGYKPSQNDSVEMDSLESFKLTNPGGIKPKPPDTYFKTPLTSQISNGSTSSNTSTIRKQRPISVTIGEYPSGTIRRTPGKLDFLHSNGTSDGRSSPNVPISNQLASELAQTLNRSNLKKRTESMENLLNSACQTGSVRISLNNSLAKSTNDLSNLENFTKNFNRVTISVSDKKMDTPNGILKNGTHKPLVQQKSITFGEMPTVINDHPLRVP